MHTLVLALAEFLSTCNASLSCLGLWSVGWMITLERTLIPVFSA